MFLVAIQHVLGPLGCVDAVTAQVLALAKFVTAAALVIERGGELMSERRRRCLIFV